MTKIWMVPGKCYKTLAPLYDHTGKCIVSDQILIFNETREGFPWGKALVFQSFSKIGDNSSYLGDIYLSVKQAEYLESLE